MKRNKNCKVCFVAIASGRSGMCVECFRACVLGDVTCRLCKKTTATQSVAYYTSYCDCKKGVGAGCIHPICNECYQGLE